VAPYSPPKFLLSAGIPYLETCSILLRYARSVLDYTDNAMNAVSIRGDWVGRTIDGRFSLLEWLGESGSSGSYITEVDGPGSQKAVIKLFSSPAQAEDRLATWTATTSLSHVHLVRILHFGRAEVDGTGLVYVVTELAEEVLGQIIPERPLTPEEARQMLEPVLDGLSYIHANGYVHGHLKPSNILVVENEVKVSADGLLTAGKSTRDLLSREGHTAPEATAGPIAPAADIWSLGVTLVEALTQQLPIWDAASDAEPVVPASLPKPFSEITRECLHIDPARRCSLSDIRALLAGKPKPATPPVRIQTPPPSEITDKTTPARSALIPLIAGFVLLVAIIIGLVMRSHKTETAPLQTETTQQAPPAEPEPKAVAPQAAATGPAKGEVLNRVVPDVPPGPRNTIQGRVTVAVRVTVDPTGSVANAEFASHGPSAYFARLAMESAHNWKFKPAQQDGRAVASTWLLRYEFRRSGADVNPVETQP
jgi:TonB family protein